MTCLVNGFKTIQELRTAVANGHDPWITDPSVFEPFDGHASDYIARNRTNGVAVCLDHPTRSKFALISLNSHGKLVVQR